MDMQKRFYQPSGEITGRGVMLMLVTAFVAGPICGLLYGYLTRWNPLVFLSIIGNLLFSGALGFAISIAAQKGNIRSPGMAMLFAVIGSFFSIFFNWVAYIHALGGGFQFNPIIVLLAIFGMIAEGVWSFKGTTVKGIPLLLLWIGEAGVFAFFSAFVVNSIFKASIFCEQCGHWLEHKPPRMSQRDYKSFKPFCDEQAKARLEGGDVSPVTGLQRCDTAEPEHYLDLKLSRCLCCNDLNVLNISETKVVGKKKEKKSSEIVDRLLISSKDADAIQAALEAQAEPAPQPAPIG